MMGFTKAAEKWETGMLIQAYEGGADRAVGTWGHGEKGGKSQAQDYDWSRKDAAGASTARKNTQGGELTWGRKGLLVSGGR